MDALAITFVTAASALVSAVVGPLVTIVVSTRQIRASLISGNRERWLEAMRDAIAEFAALAFSAAVLQQALAKGVLVAVRENPAVAGDIEHVMLARNRVLLMLNPLKPAHEALARQLEEAILLLVQGCATLEAMSAWTQSVTTCGRAVLQLEWARVKQGG